MRVNVRRRFIEEFSPEKNHAILKEVYAKAIDDFKENN